MVRDAAHSLQLEESASLTTACFVLHRAPADRAHRIGQASSVNVIFLHAKGSSDDLIWYAPSVLVTSSAWG